MDQLTLQGKSTLRAWKAGALRQFMQAFPRIALPWAEKLMILHGDILVHEQTVKNLVVLAGKYLVADLLIGTGAAGLSYHAIGTGTTTPVLTDTTLTTEAARKPWVAKTRTGTVITLSVFYLASESTYNIREAGVFGNAATSTPGSGTLFSHYLQSYDNGAGLVDLTFDYELTIS